MATGTNTVTLFLRRRNNYESSNLKVAVTNFLSTLKDVTINGIEKPVAKYVTHVWESITFDDYASLLRKEPNKVITDHELYIEYQKKLKAKDEPALLSLILEKEAEKLYYFIIAYPQKVVLIKSGKKDFEKRFLGYKFSNRRGSEGIHAIQKGKNIEDCTKLFDPEVFDNPTKASTYIYKAFQGDLDFPIDAVMQKNVTRHNLVDMLTFDRVEFEKNISLSIKKKVKIESKWDIVAISSVIEIIGGGTPNTNNPEYWDGEIPWLSVVDFNNSSRFVDKTEKTITEKGLKNSSTKYLNANDLIISARGTVGALAQLKLPMTFNQSCYGLRGNNKLDNGFLYFILKSEIDQLTNGSYGSIFKAITTKTFDEIRIPLPPLNIQEKIVSEIEVLESKEIKVKQEVTILKNKIDSLFEKALSIANTTLRLSDESIFEVSIGKRILKDEFVADGKIPVYSANVIEPFGNIDKLLITDFSRPSVLWGIDGDWMVNYLPVDYQFYPTDHCGVLRVKDNSVNEKYLAFILEKEGKTFEFSRTKRASIDRIQNIKIAVPPLSEQQKIVSEIEKIETKITVLEKEIAEIPRLKEAVLKKYL